MIVSISYDTMQLDKMHQTTRHASLLTENVDGESSDDLRTQFPVGCLTLSWHSLNSCLGMLRNQTAFSLVCWSPEQSVSRGHGDWRSTRRSGCLKHPDTFAIRSQSLKGDQSRRRYAVGVTRWNKCVLFLSKESWVMMRYMRCSFPHQVAGVVIWDGRWCLNTSHTQDLRWVSSVFLVCCLHILPSSSGPATKRDAWWIIFFDLFQRALHSLDNSTVQDIIPHLRILIFVSDWLHACNSTSQQVVVKTHID